MWVSLRCVWGVVVFLPQFFWTFCPWLSCFYRKSCSSEWGGGAEGWCLINRPKCDWQRCLGTNDAGGEFRALFCLFRCPIVNTTNSTLGLKYPTHFRHWDTHLHEIAVLLLFKLWLVCNEELYQGRTITNGPVVVFWECSCVAQSCQRVVSALGWL